MIALSDTNAYTAMIRSSARLRSACIIAGPVAAAGDACSPEQGHRRDTDLSVLDRALAQVEPAHAPKEATA